MSAIDIQKRRLMSAIIAYLRGELQGGGLEEERLEGLEVAIQCLESIYEVSDTDDTEPDLLEIFSSSVSSPSSLPVPSDEDKQEAERLKGDGNSAMNAQQFQLALDCYTRAIQLYPQNAVYYCNRAAAHSKLNDHKSAIKDCKMAIEIDPKYSKAYGRLGLAYTGLEDYKQALENYKIAAHLDPSNEGYHVNVLLATKKLSELSANPAESTSNASGASDGASNSLDLNTVFANPQLLNIASQMLSNPSMQNMMSSIMSGSLAQEGGMDALLQAGHQLAQQLQTENPDLVNQLRQTLGSRTGDNVQNDPSQPPNTPNQQDKQQ